MLTTEAKAKTKACPERLRAIAAFHSTVQMMPHLGAGIGQTVTTISSGGPSAIVPENCLGSACMAWRWGKVINVYTPGANPQEFTLSQERGGYCGKAGKPVQLDMETDT